ncbi:GNAT family N-acetyltransferase [Dactylosporangium sp. NPDC048998]|uniref:GNAT family N-acetyltransferase n=1 Tax=Dactylosporangium sp. NPDC048998 TaxID=3363976 RepID=UPI003718AA20
MIDISVLDDIRSVLAATADREPESGLALLGDKRFHFSRSRRTFVMYGHCGRSWIALGPPVGSSDASAWQSFSADAFDAGRRPAVYNVGAAEIPALRRAGLTSRQVGLAAHIDLPRFTPPGPARRSWQRLARDPSVTFEVRPGDAVVAELRPVSDAWLAQRGGRDMGFSLGGFLEAYLQPLSIGVARHDGTAVAFVSLWTTAGGRVAVDLMRHHPSAPRRVMDYLFVELFRWARDAGFHTFDLGLAPLYGLTGGDPLARVGRLVYRYGERLHHFDGVRQFKAKFRPQWTPRFMATVSAREVPLVLSQVAYLSRSSGAGRSCG